MIMLPEIIVIVTALTVLVLDLFVKDINKVQIALAGLLSALVSIIVLPIGGELLGGQFILSPTAFWFKIIFLLSALITISISYDSLMVKTSKIFLQSSSEFLVIMLLIICGMMYLVSSTSLISLYVSLELATIPLFALAAWHKKESKSAEAALKYLFSGALASSLLLLAFSFLYGTTGTMNLSEMAVAMTFSPLQIWAFILITMGVGFKMTMVPFHFWAADVYEGAPTALASFLSVASKAAGVAVLVIFYFHVFPDLVKSLNGFLAIIATMTMTLGNLVALTQKNIKRFMAFSSISQAGYILMGFMGVESMGLVSVLFYLIVYIFSNLVIFGVIMAVSSSTGKEEISDYKGLSISNPMLAFAMMLALFSLSGIPPLSGFLGKFFLFSVAAKQGFHWLVVVAALNSTVSLYYYLGIIKEMYINKADLSESILVSAPVKWTLSLCTVVVVALGVLPQVYDLILEGF
ncbi:MAG: NADH-quinone oxidoreductase subunit N [Bdellovibrionaceae bacterium]|nr:NADH-quinone oxidoreductase subunit N [Pseudobdellovibrionaceae bacterium]